MPFVTDVTDGASPSAAFFAFRAAFFFAALDLAAEFALSKSARHTFSSSMQTCVRPCIVYVEALDSQAAFPLLLDLAAAFTLS